MREEKLINRGWQFALLPCTPIDAKTAKKKELQRKQSGEDVRTEFFFAIRFTSFQNNSEEAERTAERGRLPS